MNGLSKGKTKYVLMFNMPKSFTSYYNENLEKQKPRVNCTQIFQCAFDMQTYLAEQAVVFFAHWAVESVDSIFINTPARTVCSSTVITALTSRLCNRQTPLQPALIIVY